MTRDRDLLFGAVTPFTVKALPPQAPEKPTRPRTKPKLWSANRVAIYHEMRARDTFEETAQAIFESLRYAVERFPGKPRDLFLDVDAHRNEAGGYDDDAYEIQNGFVIGFLGPYLAGGHMPLVCWSNEDQRDDVPEELKIR